MTHKKLFYLASIVTMLGVLFATILSDQLGPLGLIFIITGGIVFALGLSRRRAEKD